MLYTHTHSHQKTQSPIYTSLMDNSILLATRPATVIGISRGDPDAGGAVSRRSATATKRCDASRCGAGSMRVGAMRGGVMRGGACDDKRRCGSRGDPPFYCNLVTRSPDLPHPPPRFVAASHQDCHVTATTHEPKTRQWMS